MQVANHWTQLNYLPLTTVRKRKIYFAQQQITVPKKNSMTSSNKAGKLSKIPAQNHSMNLIATNNSDSKTEHIEQFANICKGEYVAHKCELYQFLPSFRC